MGTAWVSLCLWEVVHCVFFLLVSTALPSPVIFLPEFSCLCSHPTGSGGGGKGVSKWLYGCLAAGLGQPTASTLFYCDVILKMLFLLSFNQLVFCSQKLLFFFSRLSELLSSLIKKCTSLFFHYMNISQTIPICSSLSHADRNTFSCLVTDRTA